MDRKATVFELGCFTIDLIRREVLVAGKLHSVQPTPMGFDLLAFLLENCDRPIKNSEVYEKLWADVPGTRELKGRLTFHWGELCKVLGQEGENRPLLKRDAGFFKFVQAPRPVILQARVAEPSASVTNEPAISPGPRMLATSLGSPVRYIIGPLLQFAREVRNTVLHPVTIARESSQSPHTIRKAMWFLFLTLALDLALASISGSSSSLRRVFQDGLFIAGLVLLFSLAFSLSWKIAYSKGAQVSGAFAFALRAWSTQATFVMLGIVLGELMIAMFGQVLYPARSTPIVKLAPSAGLALLDCASSPKSSLRSCLSAPDLVAAAAENPNIDTELLSNPAFQVGALVFFSFGLLSLLVPAISIFAYRAAIGASWPRTLIAFALSYLIIATPALAIYGLFVNSHESDCSFDGPPYPIFNPGPLAFAPSDGGKVRCGDFPTIDAQNISRNTHWSSSQGQHNKGVTSFVGDKIEVAVYFQNGAKEDDLEKMSAKNVSAEVKTRDAGNNNIELSGRLSASNASTVDSSGARYGGNVVIRPNRPARLRYVTSSTSMCVDKLHAILRAQKTLAQNDHCAPQWAEIRLPDGIMSGGLNIGDLRPGFKYSGFLTFYVMVESPSE